MSSLLNRFEEFVFGLPSGFLDQQGDFRIQFNPQWPGQDGLNYIFTKMGFGAIGPHMWNFTLGALILILVWYVYQREGRSRRARISLAVIRCTILGFVLFLLNLPVFTIVQSRTEPSVLAIMVDDT